MSLQFLDELYNINTDEPIDINEKNMTDAEDFLELRIKQMARGHDPIGLNRYLRSKRMLARLRMDFNAIN